MVQTGPTFLPLQHRVHWAELMVQPWLASLPLWRGLIGIWYARLLAQMQVWSRQIRQDQRAYWLPHQGFLDAINVPFADNYCCPTQFSLMSDLDLYDYLFIRYLYQVQTITNRPLQMAERCLPACKSFKGGWFIPTMDFWLYENRAVGRSCKSPIFSIAFILEK
jgi:hypothetical protein